MTDMMRNNIFGPEYTFVGDGLDRLVFDSRADGFAVYHNVLSSFVTPGDTEFPDPEAKPVRLDNLLCEGDRALLAIFKGQAGDDQRSACQALGLSYVVVSGFLVDTVDDDDDELCRKCMEGYMNGCKDQVTEARQRGQSLPRYTARPLARAVKNGRGGGDEKERRVLDALRGARMLMDADAEHCITWYGAEMGVCTGLLSGMDRPEAVYMCAGAAFDRVADVLFGVRQPPPEEEGALPLQARLDRAALGEKSPRLMQRVVEVMGATPLHRWMADYPDELRQLVEGGLSEESTYREAAAQVYRMLQDKRQEKRGRSLLMALSAPHTKGVERS